MSRIRTFIEIYLLYRKAHTPKYAAVIAWGIAFHGLPF